MGNKILIETFTGSITDNTYVFPLLDDLTLTIESEFQSFSGMIGVLDKIKDLSITLAGAGAQISEGALDFANQFDLPRWVSTQPIRLNPRLVFFVKDSGGFVDVFDPMRNLINLTIPSIIDEGENKKFQLPGIGLSAHSLGKISASTGADTSIKGAKIISLKIPGVIYLKLAMLRKAVPTYSKNLDSDGWPIWGTLDTEIMSIAPANSTMIDEIENDALGLGGFIA